MPIPTAALLRPSRRLLSRRRRALPARPFETRSRRTRFWTAIIAVALAAAGSTGGGPAAHAAAQGSGFGTWAPISPFGWHGSMLIDGVHTYCITPGAPAPTGASADQGVSDAAAGLTPRQLVAINLLVSTYGQTGDRVQAAAVGWAVKAIANWDETLHAFGYRGDSLAGAIHWTFSRLAPEHSLAVQQRAVAFYDEAMRAGAAVAAGGKLVISADPADHRSGTVRIESAATMATGSLTLTNATFVDSGTDTLARAAVGVDYAIRTAPPQPGVPYSVSATGRFSAGFAPAVRHYTTVGGQDTAGPGGRLQFDVSGTDATPRVPPFGPTISTRVAAAYAAGGPYVDEVTVDAGSGEWPRAADGGFLAVSARATVYRTLAEPAIGDTVPTDATVAGELTLITDPAVGPGAYRVESPWQMTEPGFYVAVWQVAADAQTAEVARHLGEGYLWRERFGEPSQTTLVPSISTQAQPEAVVGQAIADTILVQAPLPAGGVTITASLYRATEGVAAAETCVTENLVARSAPIHITAPGSHVAEVPPPDRAGTYYWQEVALDAAGAIVHVGVCGVENETTRVSAPPAAPPEEAPPATRPPALAATGAPEGVVRTASSLAFLLLTVGGTLVALPRRRFGSPLAIG